MIETLAEFLKAGEGLFGVHPDWTYFSKVPTWIWILLPTVSAWYWYITRNNNTFKKLGIKGPKPWPAIGTMLQLFTEGLVVHDVEVRRKYGNIIGTFQGTMPVLLIYDVDILKQICIKDFSNFTNRFVPPISDYPVSKMLTMLKGDHWKHVRNIVTPTFSSGKLRRMDAKIEKCGQTLLANLAAKAGTGETFDFRDLCGAYTMDVIASTAFSVQIDSHNDPNNIFVRMAKKIFQFNFTNPKILLLFMFPFLMKPLSKVGVTLFPKDALKFFLEVIERSMSERQHDGRDSGEKKATDFLQLMVNAHIDDEKENGAKKSSGSVGVNEYGKRGKEEDWKERGLTHEEILAQGLVFFLAGFETTANTLSLMAYSLATHPECQDKLIAEIDAVMKTTDHIDYDIIQKMPYLDMCLNETLRLYPAGPRTDRVAEADCTINGLFIPKGMVVGIPIYALHMDPEIWPNPTEFNPERFTAEEKAARNPYYFMPFGMGPRNCVGMRLALTELKMSMVKVLQQFKFVTCPETQIPLKLDKVTMKGVNGIKLRIEKRVLL